MSAPTMGALRRHFVVEAPVAGADGGLTHELRFLAWGAIVPRANDVVIKLRARAGLQPGWRLRLGARLFQIEAVQRDETASGFVACTCRELAP
jgi:hypothetical protein